MSGGLIHPEDIPRIKALVGEVVADLDPQAWSKEKSEKYGHPYLDVFMQTEIVSRALRKVYIMARLQDPYVGRDVEGEGVGA